MSEPANSMRFDFKIDGVQIASFTTVEGLSASYDIKTHEEGGENGFVHQLPGRLKYENVKLTRPVDAGSKDLAAWFSTVARGQELRRQTASVTAFNDNRETVAEWQLADVFPVRYTGPSFTSGDGKVATETLELAHNGFFA